MDTQRKDVKNLLYSLKFIESGVQVMCDVGYLCANFSLLGLSVLDLGPMYVTDRQTSDRCQTSIIA